MKKIGQLPGLIRLLFFPNLFWQSLTHWSSLSRVCWLRERLRSARSLSTSSTPARSRSGLWVGQVISRRGQQNCHIDLQNEGKVKHVLKISRFKATYLWRHILLEVRVNVRFLSGPPPRWNRVNGKELENRGFTRLTLLLSISPRHWLYWIYPLEELKYNKLRIFFFGF